MNFLQRYYCCGQYPILRQSYLFNELNNFPKYLISPQVDDMLATIILNIDDFPEEFGPNKPKIYPLFTIMQTSFKIKLFFFLIFLRNN